MKPGALSLPSPQPINQPQLDKCKCPKKQTKKRKRKPREECWKGSYTETAKGTLKRRREKVPCQ